MYSYYKEKISITFLTILFVTGCVTKRNLISPISKPFVNEKSKEESEFWFLKDVYKDSLPGISLDLAKQELLKGKKGSQTIIAIIDTPIDINHIYLNNAIWINKNEIPNNGIDDDSNGYIDDVNGWNFQGNKEGQNIPFMKMEYTRVLKKYQSLFAENKNHNIKPNERDNYELYLKAKKYYSDILTQSEATYEYYTTAFNAYRKAKGDLLQYLKDDFSKSKLDSLKKIYPDNENIQNAIFNINTFDSYTSEKEINLGYLIYKNHLEVLLNIDYDERSKIGDNSDDINDRYYGNNNISHSLDVLTHGTRIISPIVNSEISNDSMRGISSLNKIMPVCISGYGDEHDKDIALAIRYAVDNGAKVINISFGKKLSIYKQWVFEAFKYAEKNNVLIVSSAGNSSLDLNMVNDYYPNDNLNNGKEVSKNFILVGASSYKVNEGLVCNFSNYGNIDVDIMAPGDMIRTTVPENKYIYERGTSMSASITSGIAGLIYSYYPNLTASEVKQIIMKSGVSYDIMVNKPSTSKEKELVPFSSLSKSGKVVNAYNALLMAEEVSKKKKK